LQHRLVAELEHGAGEDTLLLLQHPPVLTLGRRAQESNIIASRTFLAQHGIEVFNVERGGDVTYHGPGQLVGYPILLLNHFRLDVGWYVRTLADVLVRTLSDFGIAGEYNADQPGVWVGDTKVVAIGAHITRRNGQWITSHGFAMNVNPDMEHWQLIVPCGIADKGVTSLARLLGQEIAVEEVLPLVVKHFGEAFGVPLNEVTAERTLSNGQAFGQTEHV
ncbi:MAG: lipoyl(octanoyl) transferase LipB, partial [Chloroflexi bacterium]|nr:lipoyl(octanoyl) transferase LipB [Chloroflexota bacterium]